MKHLDLFSGIGGFALATEMAFPDTEIEHVFCDNDPFAQEILKKHWPNSLIYGDIKTLTADRIITDTSGSGLQHEQSKRIPKSETRSGEYPRKIEHGIDLLTGGFPCQPFSQAGARRGTEDDRHLWPEMLRVIRETHPLYIVGENVGGLLTWDGGMVFEQVCLDLEGEGYEVGAFVIPAAAVNAPHRRDRVWIVGHAKHDGLDGTEDGEGDTARSDCNTEGKDELRQPEGTDSIRETPTDTRCEHGKSGRDERVDTSAPERCSCEPNFERRGTITPNPKSIHEKRRDSGQGKEQFRRSDWERNWHEVAATLCRMDDGIPRRLDRTPRLKALGNAIVPQVAAEIMRNLAM